MSAVAVSSQADDRVIDWTEEIQRVVRSAPSLTPAARAAVLTVLASFESEDGSLARPALQARTVLSAASVARESSPPTETLLDALAARLHVRPSRQPAQTAA